MDSEDSQLKGPHSIDIDPEGQVYVADSGNNRVQKFTADGKFITKWGSRGDGDGEFSTPHGVTIDSEDNVYITDMDNFRVQKFDSNGNFLTKWGSLLITSCCHSR